MTSEGQQYYFLLPRSAEPNTFPPETRVSFVLVDGFDKKKGVASQQAIKLRKAE
jgi:hypothetical protein